MSKKRKEKKRERGKKNRRTNMSCFWIDDSLWTTQTASVQVTTPGVSGTASIPSTTLVTYQQSVTNLKGQVQVVLHSSSQTPDDVTLTIVISTRCLTPLELVQGFGVISIDGSTVGAAIAQIAQDGISIAFPVKLQFSIPTGQSQFLLSYDVSYVSR